MFKINNMKFVHLSVSVESSLGFYDLKYPGVFAVYCLQTNRVFFASAEDVLGGIAYFFENLEKASSKNENLVKDFHSYGKEGFQFFILDCDLEFENGIKLERAVNYYKNLYSGKIY